MNVLGSARKQVQKIQKILVNDYEDYTERDTNLKVKFHIATKEIE